MEVTFADIISVVSLLLGGGGLGFFFSWRYNRRKEKAEAEQAETTAAKEMQDMYQQMLEDSKATSSKTGKCIHVLVATQRHIEYGLQT